MLIRGKKIKVLVPPNNDFEGSYTIENNSIANGNFVGGSVSTEDWTIYNGTASNGNTYQFGRRSEDPAIIDTYQNNVFLESKHESRDQELTFTYCNGYFLLRAGTVGALMFMVKSNILEISRCSMDMDQPQFFLNHYRRIFFETDSTKLAEILAITGNNSDTWTIGCRGLDIYIKRNGVTVVNIQDWDIVGTGKIAMLNADFQYGATVVGPIIATHFSRVPLYSDTDNNIIDLRDLIAFRNNATTKGSMNISNPYTLVVDDITALKAEVGDYVSVAVGGEAPQNGRSGTTKGIIGVGGGYPIDWTDNETTLQAITDKGYEYPIALRSTGEIWRNYGGEGQPNGWYRTLYTTTVGQQEHLYNNYSIGYARGWDLRAQVLDIDGNILTLDKPCEVSTTNTDVWLDQWGLFESLSDGYNFPVVTNQKTFKLPAGKIFIGDDINFNSRSNFTLQGAGINSTFFVSPMGCRAVYIRAGVQSNNFIMRDFTLEGNYVKSLEEHDVDYWGIPHYNLHSGTYVNYSNSSGIPPQGLHMGNLSNGLIENVKLVNFYNGCLHMEQAQSCTFNNCETVFWGDPKHYAAWCVGMNDGCNNCTINNLTYTSRLRLPGLEFFGGTNNKFSNCTVVNGMISSNSGENAIIEDNNFFFEQGVLPTFQVPNNPLCNINGNNGRGVNSPATVRNNTFLIHGADAKNNQTGCINVQEGRDACLIKNNYIEYLDVPANDAFHKAPVGITTDSDDSIIEDNTVVVTNPAANFEIGTPSNGCDININSICEGIIIRRNTCRIIGAPIDNPTICIITTTGPDANNVEYIYWNYQVVWSAS